MNAEEAKNKVLTSATPEAQGVKPCSSCNGKGTEEDYVGLEMRCVEAECSMCGGTGEKKPSAPQVAQPATGEVTTLATRSRDAWHKHVDNLFDIAIPGEDIPFNALLAWTVPPSDEDIAWAEKVAASLADSAKPADGSQQEAVVEEPCEWNGRLRLSPTDVHLNDLSAVEEHQAPRQHVAGTVLLEADAPTPLGLVFHPHTAKTRWPLGHSIHEVDAHGRIVGDEKAKTQGVLLWIAEEAQAVVFEEAA